MNNKNLYLFGGILSALVFIGYLSESEPHEMFGFAINIWFIRLAWLIIAISNFANYKKAKIPKKQLIKASSGLKMGSKM